MWTFFLLYISNAKKKYWQKIKGFALKLASNCFINKYVYITKSQFLFVSDMLKMKPSLKFGKIIRNCMRNSAVNVWNHNENYNASGIIVNEIFCHNSFSTSILTKAVQEVTGFTFLFTLQVFKIKREIINYDRTIGTNRIKLIFWKFCRKRVVDLEKRVVTPNVVVIRRWFYKWKLKQ